MQYNEMICARIARNALVRFLKKQQHLGLKFWWKLQMINGWDGFLIFFLHNVSWYIGTHKERERTRHTRRNFLALFIHLFYLFILLWNWFALFYFGKNGFNLFLQKKNVFSIIIDRWINFVTYLWINIFSFNNFIILEVKNNNKF